MLYINQIVSSKKSFGLFTFAWQLILNCNIFKNEDDFGDFILRLIS